MHYVRVRQYVSLFPPVRGAADHPLAHDQGREDLQQTPVPHLCSGYYDFGNLLVGDVVSCYLLSSTPNKAAYQRLLLRSDLPDSLATGHLPPAFGRVLIVLRRRVVHAGSLYRSTIKLCVELEVKLATTDLFALAVHSLHWRVMWPSDGAPRCDDVIHLSAS